MLRLALIVCCISRSVNSEKDTTVNAGLLSDDECNHQNESSQCTLHALQRAGVRKSALHTSKKTVVKASHTKAVIVENITLLDGKIERAENINHQHAETGDVAVWTEQKRETGRSCIVSACSSDLGPTECHHFRCICAKGYIYDTQAKKCTVPSPLELRTFTGESCYLSSCGENADCINHRCFCKDGFSYNKVFKLCASPDAKLQQRDTGISCRWHSCGSFQECTNYRCLCDVGYEARDGACRAKLDDANEACKEPPFDSECRRAVDWAMHEGMFANPANYPGLHAGASSSQEVQALIHRLNPDTCPKACLVNYSYYDRPSFLDPNYRIVKGVSYGASPLKSQQSVLLNDDFMSEITGAMWADWGRGDMHLIKDLGANAMRMYGNDANTSHRAFLDAAYAKGIDIIAGMSDFGFIQGPDNCILHNWYCYDEAYFYYKKNLEMGFAIDDFKRYHPALKVMIMANEPDLKVQPRKFSCRAMASMFDAMLQAEKDVGVVGNPIAFTITWSFANFHGPKSTPALGQMEEFWTCIQNPSQAPHLYTPKNDLVAAFRTRFVNSFNTANAAHEVQHIFLDRYAQSSFWSADLKIPVFIGEYHSIRDGMEKDLSNMIKFAKSAKYPFFMGYSFFEFSKRYDKGGEETKFGMFGYNDCALLDMNYTGQVYTIWSLKPESDKLGYPLVSALKAAFGTGTELPKLSKPHLPCMVNTQGVS